MVAIKFFAPFVLGLMIAAACQYDPAALSGSPELSMCGTAPATLGFGFDPNSDPPEGATYYGTSGNDVIVISNGPVTVYAGDGDDLICVNDTGLASSGPVTVQAGFGDDWVVGSDRDDRLFGGAGDDTLVGRGGDDLLEGDGNVDHLIGGPGDDRIYGDSAESGWWEVYSNGELRGDTISGGDGDDALIGGYGADTIVGGAGNDTAVGGEGVDFCDTEIAYLCPSSFGVVGDVFVDGEMTEFDAAKGGAVDASGVDVMYRSGFEGSKVIIADISVAAVNGRFRAGTVFVDADAVTYDVAIDGDTAVSVGYGNITVYDREVGVWQASSLDVPIENAAYESVEIDGDTIVTSVSVWNNGDYDYTGLVYRRAAGSWDLVGSVPLPTGGNFDEPAVAVDGDFVAFGVDHVNGDAGFVLLYNVATEVVTTIEPEDGVPGDEFGHAVALRGSLLVVSAPSAVVTDIFGDDGPHGKAYVFDFAAGTTEILSPGYTQGSIPQIGGSFGIEMAIADDRLVIAAASSNALWDAVHVYDLVDGQWAESAAHDPKLGDWNGGATGPYWRTADVAIAGDYVIAGEVTVEYGMIVVFGAP